MPLLTGLRYTPVYALAVDPFTQPCRIAIGAGPEVHIAIAINQTGKFRFSGTILTVLILSIKRIMRPTPFFRGQAYFLGCMLRKKKPTTACERGLCISQIVVAALLFLTLITALCAQQSSTFFPYSHLYWQMLGRHHLSPIMVH